MKTIIRISLLTLALAALAATPALAQESEDPPKETSYDFTGDTIDGELMVPDGDFIDTRDYADHSSLIRVRVDFFFEIIQSAEDL